MEIIKEPLSFEIQRGVTDTLFLRGDTESKKKVYSRIDAIPGLSVLESSILPNDLKLLTEVDCAALILTGDDFDGLIEVALLSTSLSAFQPPCFITSFDYKYEDKLQDIVKRFTSVMYGSMDYFIQDIISHFSYLHEWVNKYGIVQKLVVPEKKKKKKNASESAKEFMQILSED